MANIGCQVLITRLAVKDCTEARWSALSPHRILDHLDLGPFCVKSSQSFVFCFFLRSEKYSGKKNTSTAIIPLDHEFGFKNTVGHQAKCVLSS